METIPDSSIDLVVSSPPYPMIEMWDSLFAKENPEIDIELDRGNGPRAFHLMHRILEEVWKECYRVVKPGGFVCINIGDATRTITSIRAGTHDSDNDQIPAKPPAPTGAQNRLFKLYANHAAITISCEKLGFQALPAILWRKQTNAPNKFMGSGMLPSGAYVTLEHEYILIFRKGEKRTFKNEERARRHESAFFWEERNRWFSDMWDFKGVRQTFGNEEVRSRSAAYPFELPYRLINMYSLQHDTVLDPFVGTGTTIAAAVAAQRNSIGVDIDPGCRNEIHAVLRRAAPEINRRIRTRFEDHQQFVQQYTERKGRPPGHLNEVYDIPVVTSQEKKLRIRYLEELRLEDSGEITALYRGSDAITDDSPPTTAGFPTEQQAGTTSNTHDLSSRKQSAATSGTQLRLPM